MDNRLRRKIGATLGTLVLTASLFAANGSAAQATPNRLYDCQQADFFDLLGNRFVMASHCVGPVGVQPPGIIYEIPTGKSYSCLEERGIIQQDGSLFVNGQTCTKKGGLLG